MDALINFVEKYSDLEKDINEGRIISSETAHKYLKDILNEFKPLITLQIKSVDISSLNDVEFENFVEVAVNTAVNIFNKVASEYLVGTNAEIFSNAYADEVRDMIASIGTMTDRLEA